MVLSGEDAFEKDLSKSPTLGRGKQGSKMDMMMMMSVLWVTFLSLVHIHTHKYANYFHILVSLWYVFGISQNHNWLIHVHAICSSTYMYMKNVNDATGWLSQTTDISKYFVWFPGL